MNVSTKMIFHLYKFEDLIRFNIKLNKVVFNKFFKFLIFELPAGILDWQLTDRK